MLLGLWLVLEIGSLCARVLHESLLVLILTYGGEGEV